MSSKKSQKKKGAVQQIADDESVGYTSEASVQSKASTQASKRSSKRSLKASPPDSSDDGDEDDTSLSMDESEVVKQAVIDLEEKRSSTRMSAIARLTRTLTHRYSMSILDDQFESLVALLLGSLRKGASEAEGAAKLLAVCWITLGAQSSGLYNQVSTTLRRMIKNPDSSVKASLPVPLAVIAYMQDLDDTDLWEILKEFQGIFDLENAETELLSSALLGFSLLYTQLAIESEGTELTK
jgi:hypothetical protein